MEELKNEKYFLAYLQALNSPELKSFLKNIYFQIIQKHSPEISDTEKERLFNEWYAGIDKLYDNVLETLEAFKKIEEFKKIIDKYLDKAEKVEQFIKKLSK
jgi:F0F1-type ATP synthase delta subunit